MRKLLILVAALGAAVAPAARGDAPDHSTACRGMIYTIDTYVGPTYYVDDRGFDHGNLWLYVETNGDDGLQPDVYAESSLGGSLGPHCITPLPDTLIF